MTLFISDLDGTLLNYKGELKARTSEMLNRFIEQGVKFTFATARGKLSALQKTEGLKLNLPLIAMNGVFIFDPEKNEYIVKNTFSTKQMRLITDSLIERDERPLVYAMVDGEERVSYLDGSKNLKKYLNERKYDKRQRLCKSFEELFAGEIFYITMINPKTEPVELDKIFSAGNSFSRTCQRDVYDETELWYEIFSEKASKGNALRFLKEYCGADEVVSFGDSTNDIEMFKASDRAYAVSGACAELKSCADGIIGSNDCCSVPAFIEREVFERFPRAQRPLLVEPDAVRFKSAVDCALNRETVNIGTLNEKCIHSALKYYYSDNRDHEAKIGSFYADIVNENGITEIQTANFGKLNKKLEVMLRACHVTVVYPFEKRVSNKYFAEETGELVKSSPARTNSNLTKFFLELYRIKSFLTDPNLTICVADIELIKTNIVKDASCKRGRKRVYYKTPVSLRRELYLEGPDSYRYFLPENLPERFTVKEFGKLCRNCEAKLMLEILEYVGVCSKCGKEGNALIYKVEKS